MRSHLTSWSSSYSWLRPSRRIFALLAFLQFVTFASAICSSQNTGKDFDSDFSVFQSVGRCQSTCNGYALGILQGKYCWCSNTYPGTTSDDDKCDTSCPGYPSDNCGSTSNDMYAYIELSKPSSTAAASSSTSSSSSTKTGTTLSTTTSGSKTSSSEVVTETNSNGRVTVTASSPSTATGTGQGAHTSPEEASEKSKSSSSLSGGAIAGIVIGVVGGIALIAAAALLFFCRRRRGNPDKIGEAAPVPGSNGSSYGGSQFTGYNPMIETPGYVGPMAAGGIAGGFMDSRMKNGDIYETADRRSEVSLRDDQDYSRPVLRLANPDPTDSDQN